MQITRDIARAAAWDAANRQMRKAERNVWNEDDYILACEEFARLWWEPDARGSSVARTGATRSPRAIGALLAPRPRFPTST